MNNTEDLLKVIKPYVLGWTQNYGTAVAGYPLLGTANVFTQQNTFPSILINGSGGSALISTFQGANSVGYNIWIGGGGQSSVGAVGATYKGATNTALGVDSLLSNTTGYRNSSLGYQSLYTNTTGYQSVSVGTYSLYSNTTGHTNTALGYSSLYYNLDGYGNVGVGALSLEYNVSSSKNTAVGVSSLADIEGTGFGNNTAVGYWSGLGIVTGVNNTILGANVTGLAAALSNTVILADGAGVIRFYSDATNKGKLLTAITSLKTLTLTAADDRNITFPITGTAAIGAGTLTSATTNDVTVNAHTHTITGSPALLGNGSSQYQTIITGATPFAPVYSGFLLDGTTGGKTVFAVTNAKVLTLTATDTSGITFTGASVMTVPATGTVAMLNQANSFTLINPLTTIAESWIGPSSTAGIYFKGGNYGLGTITPGAKLDVVGVIRTLDTSEVPALQLNNGDMQWSIRSTATGGSSHLDFYYGAGTAPVTIYYNSTISLTTTGKLGVGSIAPQESLHVETATATTAIRIVGAVSGFNPFVDFVDARGVGYKNARISVLRDAATGGDAIIFSNASTNAEEVAGTLNERVRIDRLGNVGIGTTAPGAKTHIDQSSTTGAIPVLTLDQADLSEEFINFVGTVGAGNSIDTAAIGTYYGKVRVQVDGVGYKYIALYNS